MEQHKFVWLFRMNRSGKVTMKPDGITEVTYSNPSLTIKHNSELQNEMTMEFEGRTYIIPNEEKLTALLEVIAHKDTEAIVRYADCEFEEVKT